MPHKSWVIRGGVAVAALGLAAACGGSSSGGGAQVGSIQGNAQGTGNGFPASTPLNSSTAKGGTLNVGVAGDVDYMDPARTYYAFSWDIHQLINRTMLTFPDGVGSNAIVPTADIADGPATAQKGNTVW